MAKFSVGKPITTTTAAVLVDAGLPIGNHRFQLEVIDSSGLRSQADIRVISVQRVLTNVPGSVPSVAPTKPTTPLTPLTPKP